MKIGNIRAWRQIDPHLAAGASLGIEMRQALANITRRYPHHRVFRRVVSGRTAEQLDPEGPFFEIFKLPVERLLDDVFQQLLPAPAPLKRRTAGNLSHMLPDCRRMGNNFEDTCDRRRVMRFAGSARHGVLTLNGRISHCRKR